YTHLHTSSRAQTAYIPHLSLHDALPIYSAVDKCVDCGFCEPACPSRHTTTTPRQRIALLREAAGAEPEWREAIEAAYDYDAERRSEEHTSELQSRFDLVCRLLLEKKQLI